ncbi:MAG: NADH-quinone oxidoreductase subunit C [Armatimonadia bacterium]
MIAIQRTTTTIEALPQVVGARLGQSGWRFGHLTARLLSPESVALEVLLLDTTSGSCEILTAPLPPGVLEYPSLAPAVPAAHRAERAVHDFFGVRAVGPRGSQSLILHDDVWPLDVTPLAPELGGTRDAYVFRKVLGEGVHEIPVGPIHAGIIEPGHFRFSCVGEIITNLEIRLGYQHRGIEKRLAELPWQQTRYLAESASSDTAAGNALAHAAAIESLLGVDCPPRAQALRTLAVEVERLANHAGDLGALAGDIGYSPGAALFPPLRGAALALAQLLSGNRRQRWYIRPGGVSRDLPQDRLTAFSAGLADLKRRLHDYVPLILDNPSVLDRMEGTGRVTPSMARDFGLVGPAARASGSTYDARTAFAHGVYPTHAPTPATRETGDVLARAQIKADELQSSFQIIESLLDNLPEGPVQLDCDTATLPLNAVGVGLVEAWRGELIHWITTNDSGEIARYAIKDPSLNNWTGLAIAVRGNLVADFPLCNKSFNLSYSGNDL